MRLHLRLALARNELRWYRGRPRVALGRALWSTLVLGHEAELCLNCGRRYGWTIWHAPDPLWMELVGKYAGLFCPRCFTCMASVAGYKLMWTPMVVSHDGVPTTNWWCDQTRDALMMGEPDPGYFPDEKVRQPQPTWERVAAAYAVDAAEPVPEGEPCAAASCVTIPSSSPTATATTPTPTLRTGSSIRSVTPSAECTRPSNAAGFATAL